MSLRGRTIDAVGWTTGAKVAHQVLQLGLAIVLTRLLGPEAFGLIGMVLVFSGFAAVFSELGFASALIQRQDLREDHRSTAFWLTLGMAAALAAIMALAAPLIAGFYREPRLGPLTTWLSLGFVLSAPGLVPGALLQKALRFDVLAKVSIATLAVSGTAAVTVAAAGGGVWSLVVERLVSSLAGSTFLLWLGGWRPRLLCSRRALRELFAYGAGLTGFKLVNYWARSADKLLIGRLLGSEALGLYSRAYSLMLLPLTQVVSVLAPVMLPALASIQTDTSRVRWAFLRVIRLLTFVTFPMMLGLAVVAEPFVLGLFGTAWRGVIPVIQILAVVGVTQALCNPTGWIYMSQGRTDWMLWWGVGAGTFLVLAIVVGISIGTVEAVALAYLIGNLVITAPCLAVPGRLIDMTLHDVWIAIRGNLLCAIVMAVAVGAGGRALPPDLTPLARLAIQVVIGVVVYAASALLSRQGVLGDLKTIRVHLASRRPSSVP